MFLHHMHRQIGVAKALDDIDADIGRLGAVQNSLPTSHYRLVAFDGLGAGVHAHWFVPGPQTPHGLKIATGKGGIKSDFHLGGGSVMSFGFHCTIKRKLANDIVEIYNSPPACMKGNIRRLRPNTNSDSVFLRLPIQHGLEIGKGIERGTRALAATGGSITALRLHLPLVLVVMAIQTQ